MIGNELKLKQDGPSSGVKLDRTQVLEKTLSPSRPFDPRYLVTLVPWHPWHPWHLWHLWHLCILKSWNQGQKIFNWDSLKSYSTVPYSTILYHMVTSLADTHLLIKLSAWSFRQKVSWVGGWWWWHCNYSPKLQVQVRLWERPWGWDLNRLWDWL